MIRVPQAHIAMGKTQVDASGTVEDVLHPKVDFDVTAIGNLDRTGQTAKHPAEYNSTWRRNGYI